ncbi:MAG TPA: sugar ABC transporter permease [Microlunatus sp.]
MSTTATRLPKSTSRTGAVASSSRPARRRKRTIKNTALFFALIAPNLLAILIFSYWPTIYNFYLSLTSWDMVAPMPTFVGLQNYTSMLTDPEFGQALLKTAIFTGVSTVGSLVGGIAMGMLLASKLRFSGFVRTMSFAPHMLPGAAVGVLWLFMFDPTYGLSRVVFNWFGADSPNWTTTSDWSIWAITIAYLWQRLGFVTIIYYTAILDLPKDVYEAAALDGATGWRLHKNVTLPLISPVTLFLSITGIISAAQAFDIIATLTGGGPGNSSTTLSWLIYTEAFKNFDVGRSATAATVMFVLLLILTFIQLRIGDRKVHYE